MFLTRLGFGSRMVITGDITQVDLPEGASGLQLVTKVLGDIVIGDLLTTASTVGHAMKVSDASRALGTVIGKALSAFRGDRGLIPILIALQ